jgi:hypothetical protein
MKNWILMMITGVVLITASCSSSFLVYKNGRGYFVGSDSKTKYDMLCTSGDMEKILADTHFDTEMKNTLYKYNCSAERSSDKVKQIFAAMTVEQRKDIKAAFRKNGYEINKYAC